jgi:hypothetical protein
MGDASLSFLSAGSLISHLPSAFFSATRSEVRILNLNFRQTLGIDLDDLLASQ